MQTHTSQSAFCINGFSALILQGLLLLSAFWLTRFGLTPSTVVFTVILGLSAFLMTSGYFVNQPNDCSLVLFFGSYLGYVNKAGFYWTYPLTTRRVVSQRIRNLHTEKLKVNDQDGNPIEIGAVIVWAVENPAKAIFEVNSYVEFVGLQCETAIRSLAAHYPYDSHHPGVACLRGAPDEIGRTLASELSERLVIAGVRVVDARIAHLAYAPEIAQAMLRRQQAHAIIAARRQIVDGAVGMVSLALQQLNEQNVVQLTEDRKAVMVSNLLVTLVSEAGTQPVVNTGL